MKTLSDGENLGNGKEATSATSRDFNYICIHYNERDYITVKRSNVNDIEKEWEVVQSLTDLYVDCEDKHEYNILLEELKIL